MKRLFAFVMLFLTALSVGGVILYSIHKSVATGGASPEIHFDKDEIEVQTGTGDEALLAGVTATDPEDGDVTDSIMVEGISHFVEKDVVNVTYVAYDSQNHVARAMRRVHYTDYVSPRFSMSGPMVFLSKNVGDLMNDIRAEDVIDGNISVKAHASFDDTTSALAAVGTHEVEISVTNSLGDTSRLLIPVRVVEDVPHSENIPLKAYLVYVNKGAEFHPESYLANADQAKGSSTMGESSIQIQSTVNTGTPGVYTVDYSLVKNENTAAFTRLIVVVD